MIERKAALRNSFIALVIYYLSTRGIITLMDFLHLLPTNDIIARSFAGEAVFAVVAIAALCVLKQRKVIDFKLKGFGEGLKAGTYILVFIGFGLLGCLALALAGGLTIGVSALQILLFVCYCLLIGVAEEVMFRGIIQNGFHKFFGERSYKSIAAAIICSGVCFGLYHLTNVFAPGVTFSAALMQALMVIPTGIVLCAAYYRSGKNIWVCVLLHAIFDGVQMVKAGMLSGSVSAATIVGGYAQKFTPEVVLGVAIIWTVLICLALTSIRKKKIHVNAAEKKTVAFA